MCNACGFLCCAYDGFSRCGCDDCECVECWSKEAFDNEFGDDDDDCVADRLHAEDEAREEDDRTRKGT